MLIIKFGEFSYNLLDCVFFGLELLLQIAVLLANFLQLLGQINIFGLQVVFFKRSLFFTLLLLQSQILKFLV